MLSVSPTFPPSCTDGNLMVLSAPANGFATGTLHVCLSNGWTPVVPTALIVSGTTLPSTCTVGALFTVTPTGGLWTCPSPNTFVPVAATIVPAKTIVGIANNTFTDVLTVTVPNAASGAVIEVTLSGSLGAGGAVGPYEATTGRTVLLAVSRTPGLATAATLVTVSNTADARVAGATTIAQTTQLSALTGGNNATQTFTLQYRITRGGGGSTNHIASAVSRVVSPTLTNITIQ